jgi:twinkle protein
MALTNRAIEWLDLRGIDAELAVRLGLTSSPTRDGGEELVIPYIVAGEVANHKYRRLDEKRFRQDTGGLQCFWNFDVLFDQTLSEQPLIITEGEFDAMVAIQCGYERVVSVPAGAPSQELGDKETTKYDFVEHAKANLRDVREIILATDGDGPGQAMMRDLSIKLGKARCKWLKYPKECKDLNETFLRYGEKGVHTTIRRAQWCEVNGLYRMSELPPYPARERYDTGIPGLDRHYRIRMGDLCVMTGVPGHGKSTFVNDILCRTVFEYGWRVAIASFEQHPRADHWRALREWYCKGPTHDAFGSLIVSDERLAAADAWIDEHFVFLVPSEDDLADMKWTLEKCAAAVVRHHARIIVVDPWNELDHDKPHDLSLTEYTGKAIKEFKRLARSLDVHVIVVAHPTKLEPGTCPGLYNISDSAHWANKPDVGVVVFKPDPESEIAEVKVVKSRYHDQIGVPGKVRLRYQPATRRFVYAPELKEAV